MPLFLAFFRPPKKSSVLLVKKNIYQQFYPMKKIKSRRSKARLSARKKIALGLGLGGGSLLAALIGAGYLHKNHMPSVKRKIENK